MIYSILVLYALFIWIILYALITFHSWFTDIDIECRHLRIHVALLEKRLESFSYSIKQQVKGKTNG